MHIIILNMASGGVGGSLSKEDIGRYGRQLILPEWGVKGSSSTELILMCVYV